MSEKFSSNDEEHSELVLVRDDEYLVPKFLDEHVASVRLRTPNNYFNEGYDVQVSAFFGAERVYLTAGEVELSTMISLQKAEVVLDGIHSDLLVLDVPNTQISEVSQKTLLERSQSRKNQQNLKASGEGTLNKVNFDISGGVQAGRDTQTISKQIFETNRIRTSWDLISDRTVRVFEGGQDLDGVELPEVTLWRAIPKTTQDATGVVARIRVREDWLTFSKTRYEKGKGSVGFAIEKLFTSANYRKQELFTILLKHLAFLGLQKSDESLQATLATAAIIVRPESEVALSAPSEGRANISLPIQSIQAFLDAEDGQEESTLVALGVARHLIPNPVASDTEQLKNNVKSDFLPRGSPLDAIKALQLLTTTGTLGVEYLKFEFGDNTVRDLSSLGLVHRVKGGGVSAIDAYKDVARAVRHAASTAPSMKVTRAVLLTNSKASPLDIADAVALKLGRNWNNDGTKKRRGSALRRWSLWLENYLIDTDSNPEAEVLVDFAKSTKKRIDAPTKVTPERVREARRLLETGLSKNKIARALNVTNATLRKILEASDL
ncbi:Helix-turn-helix domain of resolvase [Labrenzia sp. THAF82]|uniref:helix-turn-helix domain-containing protein n=1 Tax=Labrenzia sp. THAF82 TaxID=2587861 RepID=UPI00126852B7|nr:helix-turn-helix domain-containing protein [Labrenzia sp. THAF82]QFT33169.1 Helix-turn-helix domain of resolvase [Labrenzia sp. THAF82]